jgi:hypothetical protein
MTAAMGEHEEAIRQWRARERTAARRSGEDRAHRLESAACDKVAAVVDAICKIRAESPGGLACKARVAHMDYQRLPLSICVDLVGMAEPTA